MEITITKVRPPLDLNAILAAALEAELKRQGINTDKLDVRGLVFAVTQTLSTVRA